MRLIVNTNRIIAALIKDSTSRRIITHLNAELLTLSFSEKEVEKYKSLILKKAKISLLDYEIILNLLKDKLILLDDSIISAKMLEANKIIGHVDQDDVPFIAAALATDSDIWSEDLHFEKQDKIKIWKTSELYLMT